MHSLHKLTNVCDIPEGCVIECRVNINIRLEEKNILFKKIQKNISNVCH